MTLGYLVNTYPSPSHTFVRREIRALEEQGIPVTRYSIRSDAAALVDPADLAELDRTRTILDAGGAAILIAVLATVVRRPAAFAAALREALRLGWRSARGLPLSVVYLVEACVLARWARSAGVTHIHVHFGTNPAVVALLAETLGGPTYSFTVHGPEEFDRPEALKLRQKVGRARAVVAISEYGRSQLYRWSDQRDWPKIDIVRCGLDARFLGEPPTPVTEHPHLVSIGRLSEQKGQLVLVAAVAAIAADVPGLQVTLVGDGPMRSDIEAAIERHGVGSTVRLAGTLSNDDVRAELEDAKALVLPSFAEGLPVAIMESFARGRPVVSTYIAGIPELVDEACGWLVPAGSVDALVAALREVLAAPPERLAEMGQEGRRRVAERHDVAREASRLLQLLERHVGARGTEATRGG